MDIRQLLGKPFSVESELMRQSLRHNEFLDALESPVSRLNRLLSEVRPELSALSTVEAFGSTGQTALGVTSVNHTLTGVIDEMERTSLSSTSGFLKPNLSEAGSAIDNYRKHEDLYSRLLAQTGHSASIICLAESLQNPWMVRDATLLSVRGLAGLNVVGLSVHDPYPFSDYASEALRACLGDWRAVSFPERLYAESALDRTLQYSKLGFDTTLTSFPSAAFHEALRHVRLDSREGAKPKESSENPLDAEEQRVVLAFTEIRRLENDLRVFIERHMSSTHGPRWVEVRVKGKMRASWGRSQERALQNREAAQQIICYANLGDLATIVDENWEGLFDEYFHRRAYLAESVARLCATRNCAAHGRPINEEEELLYRAEVVRIRQVIESQP